MGGPPNGVPTQRGSIHGNPVTTQHQALSHWKTNGEHQGSHLPRGEGGEAAATDPQSLGSLELASLFRYCLKPLSSSVLISGDVGNISSQDYEKV